MIEGQIAAGLKNYRFGTDKDWKKTPSDEQRYPTFK